MKLELVVPTSLDEIPLKNYQEFMRIYNANTEDNEFLSEDRKSTRLNSSHRT